MAIALNRNVRPCVIGPAGLLPKGNGHFLESDLVANLLMSEKN